MNRITADARNLILKQVKKRKVNQSDRDIAKLLKDKYPQEFGKTTYDSLRRRISEYAFEVGKPSTAKQENRKRQTEIGLQILSDYPGETINTIALKWMLHFPDISLVHARRVISHLYKFKKIL